MRRPTSCALATLMALTACVGDGDGDSRADQGSAVIVTTTAPPTRPTTAPQERASATTTTADITTSPTDPAISTTSDPATTTTTTTSTTEPPRVGDPEVATTAVGEFDRPVDLAVRPGDAALYVVEQSGHVMRFDETESIVVADLGGRISGGNEQGLLGLAFSDDGRLAYLDYTNRNGDTVIAEYPVGVDGDLDVAAERILLTIDQPYRNHNAGDLEIGPDGMLFIAVGDGGSGGDPQRTASNPSTLLGSLLRIDPRPDGERPYTIPADNPFADGVLDDVAGAAEVWSWGLRNPWKFAFDPVTDDLWIADVGQNAIEEVNLVTPIDGVTAGRGVDFGWSAFEGDQRFNIDVADTDPLMPVLTYRHGDDGCSVSGGVPYRGTAIAELEPAFVYSDYCSGILWALDLEGQRNIRLLDGFENVSAVRTGPDREVYVLEGTGTLHRLVPG